MPCLVRPTQTSPTSSPPRTDEMPSNFNAASCEPDGARFRGAARIRNEIVFAPAKELYDKGTFKRPSGLESLPKQWWEGGKPLDPLPVAALMRGIQR